MSPTSEPSESITEAGPADSPEDEAERLALQIPAELAGSRLDQALARLLPDFSRSRLQQWMRQGLVSLEGGPCRPRDKVLGGEWVEVLALLERRDECLPQPIPLNVVYRDDDLLVIDKPPGLVVHPAAGNPDGTLQNGLLHLDPDLARLPRSGIVHRLDKDTSGLLVVARSLRAHTSLVEQLQSRSMKREYLAVVYGVPPGGGTVDAPIGRHPTQRVRMAVVAGGKPAVTHYRVGERFRDHALLEVRLESGRTHQIRVHLAHVHYPILGDPVYAGRPRLPKGASTTLVECLQSFRRQALHAARLTLRHPGSGEQLSWEASPPPDLADLIDTLRRESPP
jgi:23S rRNA pseudouridine1911/1915/1917 synthase